MAEWWEARVLDRRDRPTGRTIRIFGGTLEWSADRAVTGSGSLTLADPVQIHPYTERIAVTHHDGDRVTDCDVWLPSITGWQRSGSPATQATLQLSGKTELLNAPLGRIVTFASATIVTEAVEQVIRDHGEDRLVVIASPATLAASMTFPATATWLTVANALLAAIDYAPVTADATGVLHVAPHATRTAPASYGAQGRRMVRDTWHDQAEAWRIPTGVRIIVAGNQHTPGLIGAADLPDEHPLSAVSRGTPEWPRPWLLTETAQAPSQTIADQIAARRLAEALRIPRTATITHPMDESRLGDIAHHGPRDLTGPIVHRRLQLGIGAVVTDTIRHTYDGGDLTWL